MKTKTLKKTMIGADIYKNRKIGDFGTLRVPTALLKAIGGSEKNYNNPFFTLSDGVLQVSFEKPAATIPPLILNKKSFKKN